MCGDRGDGLEPAQKRFVTGGEKEALNPSLMSANDDATHLLIGMDARGAILSTERLADLSHDELRRLAEERLETFAMVEVLQGTRRVLFLERQGTSR